MKKAAAGLFAVLGCGGIWVYSALHQASRGLAEAAKEQARESQLAYRGIALDRPAPSGFEPITSPSQFSDAAVFNGKLIMTGPTGMLVFDANGALAAQYRVGLELPPAPLVRMAPLGSQLWIATHGEGLLVFDGGAFQQIRPDVAEARALTAVLPLANGRVLLGSEKRGVLVWDGQTLAQLHPGLAGVHVTALAGTETDLWAGTIDQGVLHWHAGELDRISESEGLPDARVLSIATANEAAYVGTALGVVEFRAGKLSRAIAPGFFAKSLLVRGGALAIGTLDEGVVEVPLNVRQPRPRTNLGAAEMGAVERLLDLDGRLLALTQDGVFEKGRQVFEAPGARLTDRNISALAVDGTGKLWVGYFDRGLDVLESGFEHRTHYEDEHVFCINRIVHADAAGLTAIGTANGLVLFDAAGRQRQVLTKSDGLIANNVTDVLLRPDGREIGMTVATPAGLTLIDRAGMSSLYAFHGLVNNHVYALAAWNTKLLAGTLGGLSLLDAGVVRTNYTTANSPLKQNWITAIQPSGGDWFIGTYGAGVVKLDAAGRWNTFPDLTGHVEINANAMASTPRAIYAGTLGRGLAAYNRATERWTFITSGLPSANVTALAAAQGYIYIGTENGLARIPERLLALE